MSISKKVELVFLVLFAMSLALLANACSDAEASGCRSDLECADGEICAHGSCRLPEPNAGGSADADASGGSTQTGSSSNSLGGGGSGGSTTSGAPGQSASGGSGGSLGFAGAGGDPTTGCSETPSESPTSGKLCQCNEDCDAGEICANELETGMPGGSCVRVCMESCPAGSECLAVIPGDPTSSGCFLSCASSDECPPGRICQRLYSGTPFVCVGYCQSDSDCPSTKHCDRYTGVCGDFGAHPGTGDVGDACQRGSDCMSGLCFTEAQFPDLFPGGYCSASCSLSKQGCPDGSVCIVAEEAGSDLGACLAQCTEHAECRQDEGYRCVQNPAFPDVRGCGPPA